MRIAIHHRRGSFSDYWIEYCSANNIDHAVVDCYDSDIIAQIAAFDGILWHWSHTDSKAALFARQLTSSFELAGKRVFPNAGLALHFDDKIAQKYVLEAVGAPLVPSYVFYDQAAALKWAELASYPKVFKLRTGAGSSNVRLVPDLATARRLIRRSFRAGWPARSRWYSIQEALWRLRRDGTLRSAIGVPKGLARSLLRSRDGGRNPEKGYSYFQDFIPRNDSDIRVVVIGARAFAIRRMTRRGDFRASGSGAINYDPRQIPEKCVALAFQVAEAVDGHSLAVDFVMQDGQPLLVEMSYGFSSGPYRLCPGYWNRELEWIEKPVVPERFIIEDFIQALRHPPRSIART